MYMRVHFFTVCCFPAAGVGPLAAARDPAAERDRTCLCHGACPRLLLPTATTAPVQGPQLGSFWHQELLAPQGLSGPAEEAMGAAAGTCAQRAAGSL